MTDNQKIEILKKCFEDVVWMAIRYAHGRMTYAHYMVRDAVKEFKKVFPDWEMKPDITIKPPDEMMDIQIRSDFLDDLFVTKNNQP